MVIARRRRVLILCHSPLFAATLKALLEKEKGLEVLIAKASGPAGRQIPQDFRPDVLVVEENEAPFQAESAYTDVRSPTVISLSLRSNTMGVSYKRQVPSADAQDLVRAVRGRRLTLQGRRQREERSPGVYTSLEVRNS